MPSSSAIAHTRGLRLTSTRLWLLGVVVLLWAVGSGCFTQTGSNRVQIFNEMHYQPSYRSQEAPRLLPPQGSVPITGAEVVPPFGEYVSLTSPGDVAAGYSRTASAELYRVNCTVCHGTLGKGDGVMTPFFINAGFPPADLTGPVTQGSSEGEVFGFISHGGRQGFFTAQVGVESPSPMPTFNKLLTEEDRWMLALYVLRELGGP